MPKYSGCSGLLRQCGTDIKTSTNTQCKSAAIPMIPTSAQVVKEIYNICNATAGVDLCSKCTIKNQNATYANCDLLSVYSGICQQTLSQTGCQLWNGMCQETPSLTTYCPPDKVEKMKAKVSAYPKNSSIRQNLNALTGILPLFIICIFV